MWVLGEHGIEREIVKWEASKEKTTQNTTQNTKHSMCTNTNTEAHKNFFSSLPNDK